MLPDTEQKLLAIAKSELGFQSFETHNSDSLDFKSVSVWGAKKALEAAYNLGRSDEMRSRIK